MIHHDQCNQAAAEMQGFEPTCECGGKEMTNRERAEEMVRSWNEDAFPEDPIKDIERALDEAEKRGLAMGRAEHKAGCMLAFYAGAKEMRERAAKYFDETQCMASECNCGMIDIRSLPVEGEEK